MQIAKEYWSTLFKQHFVITVKPLLEIQPLIEAYPREALKL
jgi:hypothetical protein